MGVSSGWDPDELRAAVTERFDKAERKSSRSLVLVVLGSLALFVLAEAVMSGTPLGLDALGALNLQWIGLLVGTLLFHELGHLAAMRLFGYQELGVFFIPFFGAAAVGKKRDATSVERALVLLAGPLPGLLLGSALIPAALTYDNALLQDACWMLLAINAFNLIPGGPLDGGRFLSLVFFIRKPVLLQVTQTLGALLLGYLAWVLEAYLLGVIAFVTLSTARFSRRTLEAARRLRDELGEAAVAKQRPSDEELPVVARIVAEELEPVAPRLAEKTKNHAGFIFNAWNQTQSQPPSWKASAGLLALYLFAWLVAPATLVVRSFLRH